MWFKHVHTQQPAHSNKASLSRRWTHVCFKVTKVQTGHQYINVDRIHSRSVLKCNADIFHNHGVEVLGMRCQWQRLNTMRIPCVHCMILLTSKYDPLAISFFVRLFTFNVVCWCCCYECGALFFVGFFLKYVHQIVAIIASTLWEL